MDTIRGIHDVVGHVETTDEVVLMKDATGRVIGFELLHYRPSSGDPNLTMETVVRAKP